MPPRPSFKYMKEVAKEIKKHEKIKKYAIEKLSVKELTRYIKRYEGKIVHYRGTVNKVLYTGLKDEFTLCFYAKYGVLSFGNILINYRGERVGEGDELDIWGVPKGIKTKKIFAYGKENFPEIDLIYAEIKDNWIKRPLKLNEERVEAIKQKINMEEIIREKKETQKEERKQVLYGSVFLIALILVFSWICIELTEPEEISINIPNEEFFVSDHGFVANVYINNSSNHFIVIYGADYSLRYLDTEIAYASISLNDNIDSHKEKYFTIITSHDLIYLPEGWYKPGLLTSPYNLKVQVFYKQYDMKSGLWTYHSVSYTYSF